MIPDIENENGFSSLVGISRSCSLEKDYTGVRLYGHYSQKKILLLNFADQS